MTTSTTRDYYTLLGVDARVGDEELRRAWRRLATQWHPDRAGAAAAATFREMSIAYAVLSDPQARGAYDRSRTAPASGSQAAPQHVPTRFAPGVRLSRLSGPLDALIARGIARWAEDDVIELVLDRQEAAAGGMVNIALRVLVCCSCEPARAAMCARCSGQGAVEDLFSAWLAVRPDVADGTVLTPSAWLPGMIRRVYFRVRLCPHSSLAR